LRARLQGDLSEDTQQDAAVYFNVSPQAVLTLLVNNGDISREHLAVLDVPAASARMA